MLINREDSIPSTYTCLHYMQDVTKKVFSCMKIKLFNFLDIINLLYVCMYMCLCVRMCLCRCMCLCVYLCVYACVYVWIICVYVCM